MPTFPKHSLVANIPSLLRKEASKGKRNGDLEAAAPNRPEIKKGRGSQSKERDGIEIRLGKHH